MKHTTRETEEQKGTKYFYAVGGFFFAALTGTALHFIYDLSGGFPPAGLIAPVNESVWEHLKLLYFPILLYSLWEGKRRHWPAAFAASRTCGILAGLISIPLFFYTYSLIVGFPILWTDISIFLFSVFLCLYLGCRLEAHALRVASSLHLQPAPIARRATAILSVLALVLLTAAFFWFTFFPPDFFLFEEPAKTEAAWLPSYIYW